MVGLALVMISDGMVGLALVMMSDDMVGLALGLRNVEFKCNESFALSQASSVGLARDDPAQPSLAQPSLASLTHRRCLGYVSEVSHPRLSHPWLNRAGQK